MPPTYIPDELRRQEEDAGHRCGYCLTPASFLPVRFEIEHIVPECAGGPTIRDNLWLSCPTCNRFKGTRTEAMDPETQTVVPLFNPRTQRWFEHFRWSEDGIQIIGRTAIGRATVAALRLNHEWWMSCRYEWVLWGKFPPSERELSGG
ncbi:MAG TPA: HNH endonuclease [Anaerolineae bacterium]|nr:HNH endonuclease [Anaerolineae bacterium]